MEFRDISEETTDVEILHMFRLVFPYGNLKRYIRELGYITVYYSLPGDGEEMERRIDFLPDDIYIVGGSQNEPPDGVPLACGETLYRYEQFMIARGYSEYWLNNPYAQV